MHFIAYIETSIQLKFGRREKRFLYQSNSYQNKIYPINWAFQIHCCLKNRPGGIK